MRINKISNYNTNFTSRVAILARDFSGLDEDDIIQKEEYTFVREFKKLEENGNDDDVIFDGDEGLYSMTVTKDSENGRRVYREFISSAERISEVYNNAKTAFENGKGFEYPLSGSFAKYVNRVPNKSSSSDSNICIFTDDCGKDRWLKLIENEDFKKEIEKLEKRDEKNTVVLLPDSLEDLKIYMSVVPKLTPRDLRMEGRCFSGMIYVPTPKEISKKYEEALKRKEYMYGGELKEYII